MTALWRRIWRWFSMSDAPVQMPVDMQTPVVRTCFMCQRPPVAFVSTRMNDLVAEEYSCMKHINDVKPRQP